MPKLSEKALKLMQIRIFEEDHDRILKYCIGSMTPNMFIRQAVNKVLNQLDEQTNAEIDRKAL